MFETTKGTRYVMLAFNQSAGDARPARMVVHAIRSSEAAKRDRIGVVHLSPMRYRRGGRRST